MQEESIELLERQLDRILLFFGRVESKISFLLGANASLIAIMLLNLDYKDISTWYIAIPLCLALVLNADSLFHIYRATHPSLQGGAGSYIYFSEIAARTEQGYVDGFLSQSVDSYKKDILGQIWRNSQILTQKFLDVKRSSTSIMISLLPWTFFILISSIEHARVVIVK